VSEVLGSFTGPGMEIEIALRKHDLPYVFPTEVRGAGIQAAKQGAEKGPGRPARTSATCRSSHRRRDRARLRRRGVHASRLAAAAFAWWVAIADVSHYGAARDALDSEGFNRGNSVYFPRRVIPMLPEALSNGLCSLNPRSTRLSMGVRHAHHHAGFDQGIPLLPGGDPFARGPYLQSGVGTGSPAPPSRMKKQAALMPAPGIARQVFRTLLKARAKRGAIDFGSTETQINFDDQGKIKEIVPVIRNDAHRIIEECMLSANVCASNFLHENRQPRRCSAFTKARPAGKARGAERFSSSVFGLDSAAATSRMPRTTPRC